MAYQVGIDLGTTSTVAAVCRPDGTAQVVPLEGPSGAVVSAVHLGADGTLHVGESAARRALSEPGRVLRDLTRRIGDDTPLLIGHEPVPAAEPAARLLARLVDDVARREGGVASRVAVTHPGSWGPHRVGSLRAALAEQGLGSAVLVPEPVAAVRAVAAPGRDGFVAVYDLGGGRFEASVVRSAAAGPALAGPPEEIERFGGADLDELVFDHVRTALGAAWEELDPTDPDVLAAVADLRRECTAAKEALSRDTEVHVPVALPGLRTHVRLGRAEFEEMIRPGVVETVEAMRRAIDAAGTSPAGLAALVVVGGSAQVPLVPQLLGEAFGRDVTMAADPIGAVATGAALLVGVPPGRAGAGGGLRDPEPARSGPLRGRSATPAVALAPNPGVAGPDRRDVAVSVRPPVGPRGRPVEPAGATSGPGTLPLAAAGAEPGVPSGGASTGSPGDADDRSDGAFGGTSVLPVARPPKQARPFNAVPASSPSRTGRIALVGSAAALALAVLGGVVAFGIGRIGAGQEAGAVTPASVVSTGAPVPSAAIPVVPTVQTPAAGRPAAPPPARRSRQAPPPPPATSVPPVTTAPPTAAPDPGQGETTAPPPKTDEPADGGGNDQTGNGDGGVGGNESGGNGNDDAAAGQGTGGGQAEAADAAPAADNPAADNPAADNPAADNPAADNPAAAVAPQAGAGTADGQGAAADEQAG
jgi:molecular chaperone DnaK